MIIVGNVRSLANKMDKLWVLTGTQKEHRECSFVCFTEPRLHEDIPDPNASVRGFQTKRVHRDMKLSGNRKGYLLRCLQWIALLVNMLWLRIVTVALFKC